MENYIETVLSEWIYQPHIREKIINKTFLEEGPIVLNKLGILDSYYEKYPTRLTTENISITVQTARLVAELGGLIKNVVKPCLLLQKG